MESDTFLLSYWRQVDALLHSDHRRSAVLGEVQTPYLQGVPVVVCATRIISQRRRALYRLKLEQRAAERRDHQPLQRVIAVFLVILASLVGCGSGADRPPAPSTYTWCFAGGAWGQGIHCEGY